MNSASAASAIEAFHQAQPTLGIVLGSGLGSMIDSFGIIAELPFADVPGLTQSTVPGHVGRFVLIEPAGKPVLIAQGRSHLYEGLSAHQVTAQVRWMQACGVKRIVLTNAAGSINPQFTPGEMMLVSDHLNLTGTSPLLGGPHFHDMTEVYSAVIRTRLMAAAQRLEIPLHEGVYAGLIGPQYETPAEIRMLRTLGADAVGMSTVLEAIQARALGMEVVGISTLTNWAAGITPEILCHHDVITVGKQAAGRLAHLLAVLFEAEN